MVLIRPAGGNSAIQCHSTLDVLLRIWFSVSYIWLSVSYIWLSVSHSEQVTNLDLNGHFMDINLVFRS